MVPSSQRRISRVCATRRRSSRRRRVVWSRTAWALRTEASSPAGWVCEATLSAGTKCTTQWPKRAGTSYMWGCASRAWHSLAHLSSCTWTRARRTRSHAACLARRCRFVASSAWNPSTRGASCGSRRLTA